MFCCKSSANSDEPDWRLDPAREQTVPLTAFESSAQLTSSTSVGTVTYYDGDAYAAKAFLKARVAAIVEANPWLGGLLRRKDGRGKLVFEPSNPHPLCFKEGTVPGLWANSRHIDRLQACHSDLSPFVVQKGYMLYASTASPLFQVSLLTATPLVRLPTSFAVVVTVTHIIADGHTFYTLYRMLDPSAKVAALSPKRADDLEAKEDELVGGFRALQGYMPGMAMNYIFRPKREVIVYEADVGVVKANKELAAREGGVAYVSTNDLTTAAFFQAAEADLGIMAINLRSKLPAYSDDLAGNYESCIWYTPKDVSPALIRKSLTPQPGYRRAAEPQTEYPGISTRLKGRISNCSSWTTFYGDVRLDGCTQTQHIPIFDFDEVARCMDFCIIFRPTNERLGLVCGMHPKTRAAFEAELSGALKAV